MALHLNSYGLRQKGFVLVAVYDCFAKDYYSNYDKRWHYKKLTIKCWKSDHTYLVRQVERSHVWDLTYKTADDANAKVKQLFDMHDFHKKRL